MAFYIYLFLCAVAGAACGLADIYLDDWQFWVIIFCVFGASVCGRMDEKSKH